MSRSGEESQDERVTARRSDAHSRVRLKAAEAELATLRKQLAERDARLDHARRHLGALLERLGSEGSMGSDGVNKCQQALMTVLIQHGGQRLAIHRLAMMADYAAGGGVLKDALSKLRERGWVEGRGMVIATEKGVGEFGAVPKLSTEEAFDHWLQHPRVGKCGRAILTALRAQSGQSLSREALGNLTKYPADSRGFLDALSRLRTLGLVQGRADISLSADLRASLVR